MEECIKRINEEEDSDKKLDLINVHFTNRSSFKRLEEQSRGKDKKFTEYHSSDGVVRNMGEKKQGHKPLKRDLEDMRRKSASILLE